jgi:hypothetical protein
MLLSEDHKFIFIHVAKVAGQSVTNALMPYAARPWQRCLNSIVPYRYQLKVYSKLKKRCGIAFPPQSFPDHERAVRIRDSFLGGKYQEYFTFAFVRNPWARAVSIYTYARQNPRHRIHRKVVELGSFERYVEWHCGEEGSVHTQSEYVCDAKGEVIVDFIGKQESLAADFEKVCQHLDIRATLPHFNASRDDLYREYYNAATQTLILEAYRRDVELFSYDF